MVEKVPVDFTVINWTQAMAPFPEPKVQAQTSVIRTPPSVLSGHRSTAALIPLNTVTSTAMINLPQRSLHFCAHRPISNVPFYSFKLHPQHQIDPMTRPRVQFHQSFASFFSFSLISTMSFPYDNWWCPQASNIAIILKKNNEKEKKLANEWCDWTQGRVIGSIWCCGWSLNE